MSLINKLIDIIYNIATGSKIIKILIAPIAGLLYAAIVLALFVILPIKLDMLLDIPKFPSKPLNLILSLPFIIIGLFFWLWSILNFLKVRGTPVPFYPPPRLVTSGPYARVRNPMLTGIFIMFFGIGIFFRSILTTFVSVPLFIFLISLQIKLIEEPELIKRLGNDYIEYRKRTPMFIPRIGSRSKIS